MVIQLLGLVFAVVSTSYYYNISEEDTHDFECSISSSDYSSYNKNLLFEDRNPNSFPIKHPSNVYSPTTYNWNTTYDYVMNNVTYGFQLGSLSLIFDYDNQDLYTYSVTPNITIFCDNSDYQFTYYNILPVYTLECATSSEYFNFTQVIYDTHYCSLSTQYDFTISLPSQTFNNAVNIEIRYVRLTVDLISLSEVDLSDNFSNGYNSGYSEGQSTGYNNGKTDGYNSGYQEGYNTAREQFDNQDAIVTSIFDGILGIGLLPVEFLMSIFNFEILGINFTHIISALLSLMVLVILLRIVLGGKGGEK